MSKGKRVSAVGRMEPRRRCFRPPGGAPDDAAVLSLHAATPMDPVDNPMHRGPRRGTPWRRCSVAEIARRTDQPKGRGRRVGSAPCSDGDAAAVAARGSWAAGASSVPMKASRSIFRATIGGLNMAAGRVLSFLGETVHPAAMTPAEVRDHLHVTPSRPLTPTACQRSFPPRGAAGLPLRAPSGRPDRGRGSWRRLSPCGHRPDRGDRGGQGASAGRVLRASVRRRRAGRRPHGCRLERRLADS